MALLSATTTASKSPHPTLPKIPSSCLPSLPFPIHSLRRPRTILHTRLFRCNAALSPPPQSDPPPEEDPVRPKGAGGSVYKMKEHVRIFMAVLFWLSLFFWASVWDGRNDGGGGGGGRPNKPFPFRR